MMTMRGQRRLESRFTYPTRMRSETTTSLMGTRISIGAKSSSEADEWDSGRSGGDTNKESLEAGERGGWRR